jgi:hypothetical protein
MTIDTITTPDQIIANQNDAFRVALTPNPKWRGRALNGSTVYTAALCTRGLVFMLAARAAVATFNAFSPDNDPYGEHNFGSLDVDANDGQGPQRILWKIDLYDTEIEVGSPCPEDPDQTHRVLTIMLPEDW